MSDMKVRVTYTVEITDEFRYGLSQFLGRKGKATRSEVQEWLRQNGVNSCDDVTGDYLRTKEAESGIEREHVW